MQYFLQAISYFCAASLAWENRPAPDTLIAPVTQLVGHGVELTLKANLLLRGVTQKDIRNIGHGLKALWQHEGNTLLKECAYDFAKRLHDCSESIFDKKVEALSNLYFAGKGQYPLRYESSPKLEGTYSPEFVDTFVAIAKMGVGASIEKLTSNEHLKNDALKLQRNFEASLWPNWRPTT